MENSNSKFRNIYLIGALSTIFVLCGIIIDMVVGSITGADLTALPQTAIERFNQFNENWILGLYNLDFLNLINQIVMIPTIFALYIAHKKVQNESALFAFILFLIGTTIFITNNAALTMLDLSKNYFTANSETQKELISIVGESLLIKGKHGSLGVFVGFALPTFANILMSIVMIKGKIFGKITSYIGVLGNTLMLLYIILVTFNPAVEKLALAFAMPGGLLLMAWMILFTIKFFKLRLTEN